MSSPEGRDASSPGKRLDEAVARFLAARESGRPFDQEAWLVEYADVADDLREFLATDAKLQEAALSPDERQAPTVLSDPQQHPAGLAKTEDAAGDRYAFYEEGPPPVGTTIGYFGDYELLEEIARGGMGVIYRARQCSLNRIVAVKMILAGEFASSEDIRRFQLEAEAAATLDHPGIVPIYEVGDHEGQPYFSMAYVPGTSLAEELRDGPLSPRRAAECLKAVAEAVDYAHKQGVIHRDLKPGNILLDRKGAPHVTDFGLAKRVRQSDKLTTSGQILGTPSYMPPEQAAPGRAQVRETADVYALGAVLYAALTGRPPFQADNPLDTLMQVIEQEPIPPRRLNPKIPRDLENICLKCLEKPRRRRYQFARNLAADLGRFLNGEPVEARPISTTARVWRWCQRRPVIAALLAMLMLSIGLGLYFSTRFAIEAGTRADEAEQQRDKANRLAESESAARIDQQRQRLEAERLATQLSLDRGLDLCHRGETREGLLWLARALENVPQEAADLESTIRANLATWRNRCRPLDGVLRFEGEYIALGPGGESVLSSAVGPDGNARLYVTKIPNGGRFQIPGEMRAFAFSQDGALVSLATDNFVQTWTLADGRQLGPPLETEVKVQHVAVSSAGPIVVTADERRLCQLWDAADGAKRHGPWRHEAKLTGVSLSPDARLVATLDEEGNVKFHRTADGKALNSTKIEGYTPRPVGFNRHGTRFAAIAGGAAVVLSVTETDAEEVMRRMGESVIVAALSAEGRRIVTGHMDRRARVWDAESGQLIGSPLACPVIVSQVAISSDGSTVMAGGNQSAFTGMLGYARLWSLPAGKPAGAPLRHNQLDAVAISRGGTRIVTCSHGTVRSWRLDSQSPVMRPVKRFRHPPGWLFSVEFSPNGGRLLTGCTDGSARVWDVGSHQQPVTIVRHPRRPNAVSQAGFIADGTSFFTASHDGTIRFWNTSTGEEIGAALQHRTTRRELKMVWSAAIHPDGELMITGTGTGAVVGRGDTSLRFWNLPERKQIGEPVRLPAGVRDIALTPDGEKFVTACMDGTAQLWETETRSLIGQPMRHPADVRCAAITPNGATVITGCEDDVVRLWDLQTQQQVGETLGHRQAVADLAVSPDGRLIASGGHDLTARLWDAETGRPIGAPLKHRGPVLSVAFSPDGTRLATACADRFARIWQVAPSADESREEIALRAEVTTGLMLDEHGTVRSLTAEEWQERKQKLD